MLEQYINFKDTNNLYEIQIDVLTVPFNLTVGSQASLDFLTNIGKLSDEAFYSKFEMVVDYKWRKNRFLIYIDAIIFFFYTVLVNY